MEWKQSLDMRGVNEDCSFDRYKEIKQKRISKYLK